MNLFVFHHSLVTIYREAGRPYTTPQVQRDVTKTVESLKREILARGKDGRDSGEKFQLSLAGSGAILLEGDVIADVLQDGDYLCLFPTGIPPCQSEDPVLPSFGFSLFQALGNLKNAEYIEVDGNSLRVKDIMEIGYGKYRVKLSDGAVEAVKKARNVVEDIVANQRVAYGITTGFGKFASVYIPTERVEELQESLIRSHSAGVGAPLSPEQTRRLLTLRINVLAKGFSGIRLETLLQVIDALNASCLSYVPQQGTVGASGDLAPLSHLALGLMGEGKMWSPETGWGNAKEVLEAHGLRPIKLKAKEGLALVNGTQFMTSLGVEALHRSTVITRQADVIAALSIEALQGTPRAFDYDIHVNRPHPGQQAVAARLRALLDSNIYPSEIREGHKNCSRVQDPYSMRCVPQVHGITNDTIDFVWEVLTTEMNSALDNPEEEKFLIPWYEMVLSDREETISGGNFHGEYPAKALDYLAIGVHELANISERRLERLVNPAYSMELPAFLVKDGGVNSGFMVAHCTAAALVSENKVLTHPSSVDSITTSAGQEDHVSMGGFSARKALSVVEHVERVLAIELLAACQGIEFLRPRKTTAPLEEVYKLVRSVVRPWDKDRYMAPDIDAVTKLLQEGKVWGVVKPYIAKYQAEFPVKYTPPIRTNST